VLATGARFALAGAQLFGASLNRPNPARLFGALLTYICGRALAVGLLVT
jgi:NhaP-type Na+/H+ or K+/H+ antiporter